MRYVSFFSGALGLDLGLEHAGWECLGANEVDPVACATIRGNRPALPLIEGDIRGLTAGALRYQLGSGLKGLGAVVGGPPCQAFSTAGRRRGLNDERGNVFLHFIDLAIRLDSQYVVIENVRGLLSAPLLHRPHCERGAGFPELTAEERAGGALRLVVSTLEAAGYSVSFRLYDTSRFGVPQVRERVVLIASQGRSRVPHLTPVTERAVTVREAFRGLSGVPECAALRARAAAYLGRIGEGQNWRSLPEREQREALGGAYMSGGGRTGFLRRLAWDKPAPTLVTSPAMPATLLAHPEEDRVLSVQEYLRLQTFPDDWVVAGRTGDKYRQIGNAVPVAFGRVVGRHILDWDSGRIARGVVAVETSRYRGTDESSWLSAVG